LATKKKKESDALWSARLLLVDDDRLILHTLGAGLAELGYPVVTAESAAAAIDGATSGRFGLAIIDIRLPDISGIALARTLREVHDLDSLILTALDDRASIDGAIRAGVLGYLIKPVDVWHIAPQIETALWRSRERAQLRAGQAQLQTALEQSRDTSVAIGVLMERERIPRDQAFEKLRALARSQRRSVAHVASELLAGLDPGQDTKSD